MTRTADLEGMTILLPDQCALVLGGMFPGGRGPCGPFLPPPQRPNLPQPLPPGGRPGQVPAPSRPVPLPVPRPLPLPRPLPPGQPFPHFSGR